MHPHTHDTETVANGIVTHKIIGEPDLKCEELYVLEQALFLIHYTQYDS